YPFRERARDRARARMSPNIWAERWISQVGHGRGLVHVHEDTTTESFTRKASRRRQIFLSWKSLPHRLQLYHLRANRKSYPNAEPIYWCYLFRDNPCLKRHEMFLRSFRRTRYFA